MAKNNSQEATLTASVVRDQHGRKWSAIIEKQTGCPAGPVIPMFVAPVMPPVSYVEPTQEFGQVSINYDAWLGDVRRTRASYQEILRSIAESKYADKAGEMMENPTPLMLKLAGAPPMSDRPILACQAGNAWVLGLSEVRPKGSWTEEVIALNKPKVASELAFLEEDDFSDALADDGDDDILFDDEVEEAEEAGGQKEVVATKAAPATVTEAKRPRGRPRKS